MNYNNNGVKPVKKSTIVFLIVFFSIISIVLIGSGIFVNSMIKEMESDINVDTSKYDQTVSAVIIENQKGSIVLDDESGGHETETFKPIYQYEYKGKTYTSQGDVSSTQAHYTVGDKTDILISSDNPSDMYDPNYNAATEYKEFKSSTHIFAIIPTIIGCIPILIFIIFIIIRVNRAKNYKNNTY